MAAVACVAVDRLAALVSGVFVCVCRLAFFPAALFVIIVGKGGSTREDGPDDPTPSHPLPPRDGQVFHHSPPRPLFLPLGFFRSIPPVLLFSSLSLSK